MYSRCLAILFVQFVVLCLPSVAEAAPTRVTFATIAGDFNATANVYGPYFVNDGTWMPYVFEVDGNPDTFDGVLIDVADATQGRSWGFQFLAPRGENLRPGFYGGANRTYSDPDSPFIDINGNGSGCNRTIGNFTVLFLETEVIEGIRRVKSFAARFEIHCGGGTRGSYGVVCYEAPPLPIISSISFDPAARTLSAFGLNMKLVKRALVDGAEVQIQRTSAGAVVLGNTPLGLGEHKLEIQDATGKKRDVFPFTVFPEFGPSSYVIESDAGDPVGGGSNESGDGGPWSIELLVYQDEYEPYEMVLDFAGSRGQRWRAAAWVWPVGHYLSVGSYANARYPQLDGMPSIFVQNGITACSEAYGAFEVTNLTTDNVLGYRKPKHVELAFEQRCTTDGPALRGRVVATVPEPPQLFTAVAKGGAGRLIVKGRGFEQGSRVHVDGRSVTVESLTARRLVLSGVPLSPGLHSIALTTAFGTGSAPLLFRV